MIHKLGDIQYFRKRSKRVEYLRASSVIALSLPAVEIALFLRVTPEPPDLRWLGIDPRFDLLREILTSLHIGMSLDFIS
jgi:hypothetical protein